MPALKSPTQLPNVKRATARPLSDKVKLELGFDYFSYGCTSAPELAEAIAENLRSAAALARQNANDLERAALVKPPRS